jgi:predicted phage terminase large subunit-like protein
MRPGGLIIVIQTRWHRDDLSGRLLREAEMNGQLARWKVVKLPALAEPGDPLGRSPGEALWPEMYSVEWLEAKKASKTNYYWRAMYQQDPLAEGGTEWPESYFGPSIWFDDWPKEKVLRVVALDPSKGKDGKIGDYSAFVMMHCAPDKKVYIDADLGLRNTSVITDTALEIQRTFAPNGFVIETNQFQELLADELRRRAAEERMELPLYHVDNTIAKVVRIRRLTPFLSEGMFRFKANSPGARLLVDQLRDFPCGAHDDGPDALEMALRLASQLLAVPWQQERVVGRLGGPYW